jgi:hypothetical protein
MSEAVEKARKAAEVPPPPTHTYTNSATCSWDKDIPQSH